MKIRNPYCSANVWSSGKVTVTGTTRCVCVSLETRRILPSLAFRLSSEDDAQRAARRIARVLQRLGFKTKFRNFRVVNCLATCAMPWPIDIVKLSRTYPEYVRYRGKNPWLILSRAYPPFSVVVTNPKFIRVLQSDYQIKLFSKCSPRVVSHWQVRWRLRGWSIVHAARQVSLLYRCEVSFRLPTSILAEAYTRVKEMLSSSVMMSIGQHPIRDRKEMKGSMFVFVFVLLSTFSSNN